MTEYSRMAKGSYTVAGSAPPNAKVINLPFQPTMVKLTNYTAIAAQTNNRVAKAMWVDQMGQGFAVCDTIDGTPAYVPDVVTSNGISTFSKGEALQFGAQIQISGITKAAAAVVTTGSAHGYSTGDVVVFQGLYQSATTGMPQIDTIPFTVTVTGATTFTIPWNTNQSNYTALSGSPTGAFVKKVLNPYIYFPEVSFITAISTGATTTINTTHAHNLVAGQQVAFRIPSEYDTTELNNQYGYVTSVTDYNTVVVNINSSSYTAFDSNQTVASVPGLNFAQMVAVGDVNTGGVAYSGGNLYPSPQYLPAGTAFNTINGPAIRGSFVNNTRQGFVIGPGACVNDTSAYLGGAASDVIYWEAYYMDLNAVT